MDPNLVANYAWFVNTLKAQGNETEAFEWFLKWQSALKVDDETLQAYKTAYQISGWQVSGASESKDLKKAKSALTSWKRV